MTFWLCQKQNLASDWLSRWRDAGPGHLRATLIGRGILRCDEIHRSRLQTHFTTFIKRKIDLAYNFVWQPFRLVVGV